MTIQQIWSRYLFPLVVLATYLFMYVPLVVLVVFSFNDNELSFNWVRFTTAWYADFWHTADIWHAFYNSLIVAVSSAILSLSMSSLFIFFTSRSFLEKLLTLFYINLAIPEIVLAVGLMSFFYFFSVPLGMTTLIAAHTVLGLGYVAPIIYDRYIELDKKYMEASLDLGATPWQTFRLIVLPLLSPALLSSALLVFILSFDDFILSFFCAGGSTETLPMYIFAVLRTGVSPTVSALSTVLLLLSSLFVLLFLSLQGRRNRVMR